MYICVPCGARLNRPVCNGPVSPLDIASLCFGHVISLCLSLSKKIYLAWIGIPCTVGSFPCHIPPSPLFRIPIPERLETKATTSSTFGHVHDVPVGAEVQCVQT